jgi:predicted RNA-binding Zn ribbon-like protein
MDALPLEAGDYPGTYKLVGGRLALDFVNTVSWPDTSRSHDWLDQPGNAVTWAEAVSVVPAEAVLTLTALHDADPVAAAGALQRLQAVRSDLAAVLSPLAHGDRPSPRAIERLNRRLTGTCRQRRVDPSALAWTWGPVAGLDDLHGPLACDAADIVTHGDHTRLGHCPSCDWLFLDTTRNRSRRWCDMDDCGSRAKALRYYHRQARP